MSQLVFLTVMFLLVAAIMIVVVYGLSAAEDRGYADGFKDGQNSVHIKKAAPENRGSNPNH